MDFRFIGLSVDSRGVARLELNRPEKHNSISERMFAELLEAVRRVADDASIRALVLTGRGESFCSGGDLDWFLQSLDEPVEARVARSRELGSLLTLLHQMPKPVIGRINGLAIGAGAGLVAVCDVAVALERATFGFSETRIGLVPATFAAYVLRRIGAARARSVMMSGARFDAAEACRIGLVDETCADVAALDTRVERILADHLAASSAAMALTKQMIEGMAGLDLAEAQDFAATKVGEAWRLGEAEIRIPRALSRTSPARDAAATPDNPRSR